MRIMINIWKWKNRKILSFLLLLFSFIRSTKQFYDIEGLAIQDEYIQYIPDTDKITFSIADDKKDKYELTDSRCLSLASANKILDNNSCCVCKDLDPCTKYEAQIGIQEKENKTNHFQRTLSINTSYIEPSDIKFGKFDAAQFSMTIRWDGKHTSCVGKYFIFGESEDKDKTFQAISDYKEEEVTKLNPCQKYFISLTTFDVYNKIIKPNQTTSASTNYIDPGKLTAINFQNSTDGKFVKVTWKLPQYTTCVNYYYLKWRPSKCLDSDEISDYCNWKSKEIKTPTTSEYSIDDIEGCEVYNFVISTNDFESNETNSISSQFTSPTQVPGAVQSFIITNTTAANTTFTWQEPSENALCVFEYEVYVSEESYNIKSVQNIVYQTNKTYLTLSNLKPCGHYTVRITPWSKNAKYGQPVTKIFTVDTDKPSEIQNAKVKYSHPFQISLNFSKPIYGDLCIDKYRITGWSKDFPEDTDFQFHQTHTNTSKILIIDKLTACMEYEVQIIPVTTGSPPLEGTGVILPISTTATTTSKPDFTDKVNATHSSIALQANNGKESNNGGIKNRCEILFAKFECEATQEARIEYAEALVTGEIGILTFAATLKPLSPFTKYQCSVRLFNIAGWSEKNIGLFTTDKYFPEMPKVVNTTSLSSKSISIEWEPPKYPNGNILLYKVYIQMMKANYDIPARCNERPPQNLSAETSSVKLVYENGYPYTMYSVQVAAQNDFGIGMSSPPLYVTTKPQVSEPADNFGLVSIDGPDEDYPNYVASVTIKWLPPCQSNGKIWAYNLNFIGKRHNYTTKFSRNITSPNITTNGEIQWTELTLQPEYNYTVSLTVLVENVEEKSIERDLNFIAPSGIPEKIDNAENLTEVDSFSASNPTTSALVKFSKEMFTSKMGEILYAALLLSEIGCQIDPNLEAKKYNIDKNGWPELKSWKDSQNDKCVRQYQTTPKKWKPAVIPPNPKIISIKSDIEDPEKDKIEYVIGSDQSCDNDEYCNGPLKPNTKYKMILRIFTNNGYRDTVSMAFKTDEAVEFLFILLICMTVLLIAFLFGFLYFWINKRRLWYRQSLNGIEDQLGDVTTKNFLNHYQELTKKEKVQREFKELAVVANDICLTSSISRYNESKNRYSNIFPYEKNRVILDIDSDGSDYINASFINGYQRKKEYIATQGPKPETSIDFWKMVLQYNVRLIVMVTDIRENDVIKCHQYFPIELSKVMKFGTNITVVCKRQTENDIYERREITVKHNGDDLVQNVIHYFFKKWPDHDCPSDPLDLIAFVKRIKSEKIPSRSPIVVHCSAGVGRTGTFIGLDIIVQRMKNEGKINIYETVKELRFQRMKMVQTMQQYQFLYSCANQLVRKKFANELQKSKPTSNGIEENCISDVNTNHSLSVISNGGKNGKTNRLSFNPNDIESVM